jgi:hypothetical protein
MGGWPPDGIDVPRWSSKDHQQRKPSMGDIGLDLAKKVFQFHAVDAVGSALYRWQLRSAFITPVAILATTAMRPNRERLPIRHVG